jgi:RHH-type rel operon transcriptional repressor/antitoxin RelB
MAQTGDDMLRTTVHIRPELAAGLDELATRTGRERADLAEEAVARYLDYERWATEQIAEGLRQADAGQFASDEEMDAIFGKYRDAADLSS